MYDNPFFPGANDIFGSGQKLGLVQRARNLINATAEHVADGLVDVDDEEYERRISICRECPLFDLVSETCALCGCYMQTKAKWRSSICPDIPPRW